MKKLLFIVFICWTLLGNLQAAKDFTSLGKKTYGTAISPNGRYIVGTNGDQKIHGLDMVSFVYDMQTKSISWPTEFDADDLSKGGQFENVNDEGTICGMVKDMNHQVTWDGVTGPTSVAAVWKNGTITKLPYGNLNIDEFIQPVDGTFALAISNNGKIVVGYACCGNYATVKPCKWTLGNDGNWSMEILPMPEGGKSASAFDISEDGSVILGSAQINYNTYAIYWKDGICHRVQCTEEDADNAVYGIKAMDLSPNGRYFTFALSFTTHYRIFDVETGTYRTMPGFDSEGMANFLTVDNNGNVTGAFTYGSAAFGEETYNHPFYYRYSSDRLFDLTYYMSMFAAGVTPDFSFDPLDKTQVFPFAMSADGNTILGNTDVYSAMGQIPTAWILRLEPFDTVIPDTPEKITGISENLRQVVLSWKRDMKAYDGLTLKGYNVYCNGKPVRKVEEIKDEMQVTIDNADAGYPQYSVEAIFKDADGKEILSPRSIPTTVTVADNYSLPLFDNFDDASLQTNYWTTTEDYGEENDKFWGTAQYAGHQATFALATGATTRKPYSNSLVSRQMDATKADMVKFSFMLLGNLFYNPEEPVLDKDTLTLEVSTDKGHTWTPVKDWIIGKLPKYYTIQAVDISKQAANKIFTIRLRKHGEGKIQYYIYMDNLKVGIRNEKEAPKGVIGEYIEKEKKVKVLWQDMSQAYPLNYVNEEPMNMLSLGNEGKELIGANMFTTSELALYHGKYLTSVSTTINYYSQYDEGKGIHASIVVFEDGKLIREQAVNDMKYNEYITRKLDEPVLIDKTKELKIGIKVYDYDTQQIPLLYSNAPDCIPGKSDLYSEDNGKTWHSVHKFFTDNGQESSANCCWYITGNVTETTACEPSADAKNLIGYNIFRNGEQMNEIYIPAFSSRYIDTAPVDNASYEVVAYYADGSVSETSQPYLVGILTHADRNQLHGSLISYADNILTVNGHCDRVSLMSANGQTLVRSTNGRISLSGIPAGVYVVVIQTDGRIVSQKIVKR